jgi:glycosyltransferase involved in cell wall biosynthesis
MNVKVVLDMDDDWVLPPNHIANRNYAQIKDKIINNIRQADMVTTTNERLADKLIKYNSNVHIFENALPYGLDQFTENKIESEKVRLFWCGSITHQHDIDILKYPLRRLHSDKVQMVMGGYDEKNHPTRMIWDAMASTYTNNKKLDFKILRSEPPTKYMAMYQEADIAIIPLEKSDWHACKSNLKILESASKKIPCIVSAVDPYYREDCPALWVHKQSDWNKHINYLLKNEQKRKEIGEQLYEWAKSNFNFAAINERRRAAFASLIKV